MREKAVELFDLFLQTDARVKWTQQRLDAANALLAPAQEAQAALEVRVKEIEATLATKTAEVEELLSGLHETQQSHAGLVKERDALKVQILTVEAAMRRIVGVEHRTLNHEGSVEKCPAPRCAFTQK